MTNEVDHYAKIAAILNRKDIDIVQDFSEKMGERYNVVTWYGVKLLSVRKCIGKSLNSAITERVGITCETDGCVIASVYENGKKMPEETACFVYGLLKKKYNERLEALVTSRPIGYSRSIGYDRLVKCL